MSGLSVRVKLKPARAQTPEPVRPKEPAKPAYARPERNRAANQLALAHHVQRLIDDGVLADYADVARRLGVTRARLTQIANLLLLAPVLQERVLKGELVATERALRAKVGEPNWEKQLAMSGKQSEYVCP